MSQEDIFVKLQQPLSLQDKNDSISTEDSFPSIVSSKDCTFLTKKKIVQEILQESDKNSYIESKRLWMVPFICTLLFGSFYNLTYQSFIKEQLMSSMQMSNFKYQMFVLIPNLPNIPLPMIIGPALDVLGARNGVILFTFLVAVGMAMCMIADPMESFAMILCGKVILSVAIDAQTIAQGCILGKWYKEKGLATVFTLNSLICKVASSTSGIFYPMLYEKTEGLFVPFLVGLLTCIISCISAVFVFILDRKADQFQSNQAQQEGNQVNKHSFKFSDFKKFYGMFWCFAILSPLTFGAFSAFQNYLQSVLTHKFSIDRTMAGQMLSIPYWIAFTVPIFGICADKFGKRLIMMVVLTFLSVASIFTLFILPTSDDITLVWISLVVYGLFLSLLCAYLYPTVPLITQKHLLSTGFGITHTTRSAIVSLMSYFGSFLMREDNSGSNDYLLTYSLIFFTSFLVSIYTFFYDKKNGGYVNSTKPLRFLEVEKEKELLRNTSLDNNRIEENLIISSQSD